MEERWVEMENNDLRKRKRVFKGFVEREVVKQWLLPITLILGILLGLSVALVLPKLGGSFFPTSPCVCQLTAD